MKRRKFLLSSGSALLGATAVNSVTQEPVIGLNFDIVGVENVQPSELNSIIVDFQNFELVPKYVETSNATVTVTLNLEGYESVSDETTVKFVNGQVITSNDLGSIVPIVIDELDINSSIISGDITIEIEHSNVSDSYTQSFTITDDSLQQGLVGYWPLHEWSGKANDLSVNNNHGAVNGATQGVLGQSGLSSYYLNGTDDWIDCGDISQINNKVSVSLWYRPPDSPWGGDASNNGLVSKGVPEGFYGQTDTTGYHIGVSENQNNPISVFPQDGDDDSTLALSSMNSNEWNHIAFTIDADNNIAKGYLNGQFDRSISGKNIGNMSTTSSLGIGRTPNAGGGRYSKGYISQVRIYDRIISESEVEDIYQIGSVEDTDDYLHNGSSPSSVSRWSFDDNSNTSNAIDSWSDNTGVINGATYSENSINNSSLSFDSNNPDNVVISDGVANSPRAFSFSVWVKHNSTGSDQTILSEYTTPTDDREWRVNLDSNLDSWEWTISSDGTVDNMTQIKGSIPLNTSWNHLCGTWDGENMRLYINGVEDASGTIDSMYNGNSDLYIGSLNNGNQPVNGFIDDVRIFNKSLNPNEINQLYRYGTQGRDLRERTITENKNDMKLWWKLNETSGSTVQDYSGNANNGSANNEVIKGVDGVSGSKAYEFDRDSGRVDLSSFNIPTDEFTITAWIDASVDKYNNNEYLTIFDKFDDSNNEGVRIIAHAYEDIRAEFDGSGIIYPTGGTGTYQNMNLLSETGKYNFVAVQYDGSSFKCWVDNRLNFTYSGSSLTNPTVSGVLGNQSDGGWGGPFDGRISDFRIYDRTLSPQEMSYLYEQKF